MGGVRVLGSVYTTGGDAGPSERLVSAAHTQRRRTDATRAPSTARTPRIAPLQAGGNDDRELLRPNDGRPRHVAPSTASPWCGFVSKLVSISQLRLGEGGYQVLPSRASTRSQAATEALRLSCAVSAIGSSASSRKSVALSILARRRSRFS